MSGYGLYVTGTDTGIGKTVASVALLGALRAHGSHAVGMKPVASGCAMDEGEWRNEDALALLAASAFRPAYSMVNPYALPEPTAPELAAAAAGKRVDLGVLCEAYAALAAEAEHVVVEGVGGWLAPLAHGLDQSVLVHALDLPVVMVVGLRLGCLNHARLTARAIAADGCRLLGWIGNRIDPEMNYAEETLTLLARELDAPCLGVLSFRRGDASSHRSELNLAPMAGLPS
jgi:dethiobiotin synthetase